MLVTSEPNSGPPSRCPSILDSPTLARVERARLRLEASNTTTNGTSAAADTLERKILDPKVSVCLIFMNKLHFRFHFKTIIIIVHLDARKANETLLSMIRETKQSLNSYHKSDNIDSDRKSLKS